MARDLRTRLAGIRSSTSSRPVSGNTNLGTATDSRKRILPGWNQISQHFWTRQLDCAIDPLDTSLILDAAAFSVRLKDVRLSLAGMRFFDLETTGLSGGTGTVAFLATVGRFKASNDSSPLARPGLANEPGSAAGPGLVNRFQTTQYFMDDYPGEPALIQRLAADLAEAESIVTYNGGSFDLPLFRTRCVMCGLRPPELPWHMDLLTVARRLWRGVLPDCSLGTIERQILSIDRGPDLPGSAIPERWFSFLRGDKEAQEALSLVFSHNDHDVRTLAMLLLLLARGFETGQVFRSDPVGLAVLLGRSNPELALHALEAALAGGETRAVKPLMRTYWKSGRHQERLDLVPQLPDDPYGLYMKSVRAEKVDRNLEAAISLAHQALGCANGSMAVRLENRLDRLKRKMETKTPVR